MSQTNLNPKTPKTKILAVVVVPIAVALLGSAGFWQYLQNSKDSQACQINASKISVGNTVIEANKSLKVSIRADNPDGKPFLYNWKAVYGQMNPDVGSINSESTYTTPPKPVNDTISVEVTSPNCESAKSSEQISVTSPSSSTQTPTPLKMSTLVPSTPPSNSSPSPSTHTTNLGINLIKNPGFEEGFAGWEQNNPNNAEHKLESGYKSSKAAACSIQKALPSQRPDWVGVSQDKIEVKADHKYRVEALLSWENGVEVHFKVAFLDRFDQQIDTSQVFNSGKKYNSGGWVPQGGSVTAPKNTVSAIISIWHGVLNKTNVANSKLCIDDVVFAPIGN